MSAFKPWLLAFFAVAGAFFLAGLTGSFITDALGFWHIPGAGFAAAFAVVVTTFFASPSRKLQMACLALAVGGLVSWRILEPSSYPEMQRYGDLAYQPTHLPLIATLSGGFLGLLFAFILRPRPGA